jgi:hypothetical protein
MNKQILTALIITTVAMISITQTVQAYQINGIKQTTLKCYEEKALSLTMQAPIIPYNVDPQDPNVKQFIKNLCQYQINLGDKVGSSEQFYPEYYPNGTPESIEDLKQYLEDLAYQ